MVFSPAWSRGAKRRLLGSTPLRRSTATPASTLAVQIFFFNPGISVRWIQSCDEKMQPQDILRPAVFLDDHLGLQDTSRPSLITTPLCPSPVSQVHVARTQSSHFMEEESLEQGLRVGQHRMLPVTRRRTKFPAPPQPQRDIATPNINVGNIVKSQSGTCKQSYWSKLSGNSFGDRKYDPGGYKPRTRLWNPLVREEDIPEIFPLSPTRRLEFPPPLTCLGCGAPPGTQHLPCHPSSQQVNWKSIWVLKRYLLSS